MCPGCGGILSTPSGVITSKNYPSPYPHGTDCEWLISVEEGRTVQLTFHDFDIEGHATCNYDNLQVRTVLSSTAIQ